MKKYFPKLKNFRGIALIYTALTISAVFSFMALALDLTMAYVATTELKAIGDATSLTAASSFTSKLRELVNDGEDLNTITIADIHSDIQSAVDAIKDRSHVLNISSSPVEVTIQYGSFAYDNQLYDGSQFTAFDPSEYGTRTVLEVGGFQILAHRDSTSTFGFADIFAHILGQDSLFVERESVSILAPRNFQLVIDTSSSMDNLSYPPDPSATGIPRPPETTYLTKQPFNGVPDTPWFSPYSPASGAPRFTGFETEILPQPLQIVLDSSLQFLVTLASRSSLLDSTGIVYFSESAASKLDPTDVTAANVAGPFTTLLTNSLLYENLAPGANIPPNEEHFVLPPAIDTFNFSTSQYNREIAVPFGSTNIGNAIDQAVSNLAAAAADSPFSIAVIILFTDGNPTCAPPVGGGPVQCFSEPLTADQAAQARNYTFQRAQAAISQGIYIYPISYGALDAETLTLLDEIASLSGLASGHYQVGSSTDIATIQSTLNDIFDDIAQLIPFVLVG